MIDAAYDPYQDPRFVYAEHCVERVSLDAFGWHDAMLSWHLMLDAPFDGEGNAIGTNSIGEPFSLTCLLVIPLMDDHGTQLVGWMWSGLLEGPVGSYPCHGVAVVESGGIRTVPVLAWADRSQAFQIYDTLAERGQRALCALDEIASITKQQNELDAQACFETKNATFYALGIGVSAGTAVACLATPPVGCVAGLGLMGGLIISNKLWEYNYEREWSRSWAQLCIESSWRTNNPGEDFPVPSRGKFECPNIIAIP